MTEGTEDRKEELSLTGSTVQHKTSITPTSVVKNAKGNSVMRLPFDATEGPALQQAVGQMVTIGVGAAATTGYLVRYTPIDGNQMEIELA